MEVTKEQELEMLKEAGIEDEEAFIKYKKLIFSSNNALVYEDEYGHVVFVGFKIWSYISVYNKGDTHVYGKGGTFIRNEDRTITVTRESEE